MRHTACGGDFAPQVTCRSCGETASEKDVVAQWGPSGSWARSVPAPRPDDDPADQRQAGLFPQTMSVLGNRWAFALLVAAFVGVSRFTDFQTQLGAPPGSDRRPAVDLRRQRGAVRCGQPLPPDREGPRPLPVLISALQWAQRWFRRPRGPAVVLTHTACGRRFTAV